MQITLNKNSWHFRYYRMVIGDTPPKSLCPYFWSVLAITVVSPVLLIALGIIKLISMYGDWKDSRPIKKKSPNKKDEKIVVKTEEELLKEWNEKLDKETKRSKVWNFVGKILLGIFLILILFIISSLLYDISKKVGWFEIFKSIFAFIGFIGVVVFIFYLWFENEWGDKIVNKFNNLSVIKMTKGMIVATYEKACPLIKWEDDIKAESVNN